MSSVQEQACANAAICGNTAKAKSFLCAHCYNYHGRMLEITWNKELNCYVCNECLGESGLAGVVYNCHPTHVICSICFQTGRLNAKAQRMIRACTICKLVANPGAPADQQIKLGQPAGFLVNPNKEDPLYADLSEQEAEQRKRTWDTGLTPP